MILRGQYHFPPPNLVWSLRLKVFDEVEHISYANVFSAKCTMPVGWQCSQKQYKALSIRAWDSATVNISLTWPCTEPCVFSITSRHAAFMDCWVVVSKEAQWCTRWTASIVICPDKYAEGRTVLTLGPKKKFTNISDWKPTERQDLSTYW